MPTRTKAKVLIESKRILLFDLDGTLYLGNQIIPGALELVEKSRKEQKRVFFFTNNSSRSHDEYVAKLKGMGFAVSPDEIVMSTHTLIRFLYEKKLKRVFLLGTPSMTGMLQQAGIETADFEPDAVVVGFDKTLTYEKLKKACRLVQSGLPYIVTHPDLFCPTEEGPEPDCGAFARVIEAVTTKAPLIVLGKPHPRMIQEVVERTRAPKSSMLLIGDRLTTDIAMGKKFGVDTVLVLTGETKKADLRKLARRQHPTLVVPSVAALL